MCALGVNSFAYLQNEPPFSAHIVAETVRQSVADYMAEGTRWSDPLASQWKKRYKRVEAPLGLGGHRRWYQPAFQPFIF